jgi:FtsH-binding integral membrane protein
MAWGYESLGADDLEACDGEYSAAEFADKTVRQGFVRKVLGLVTTQLLITAAISMVFVCNKPVQMFVAQNPWVLWTAFGLNLGFLLMLACFETLRKVHPYNLIGLFAFTILEGFMVGAISAQYDTNVLLIAFGLTAAITVSLVLFALQTKVDFTMGSGILFSLLVALIMTSILQLFLHLAWLDLLISFGGAALFSCYIVVDIQLLVGGNHRVAVSPDEYVLAAINIYLDIINLFLYILRIVSEMQRD